MQISMIVKVERSILNNEGLKPMRGKAILHLYFLQFLETKMHTKHVVAFFPWIIVFSASP